MRVTFFLLYAFLFSMAILQTSCQKDDKPDVSGLYIGTTREWNTWANPITGSGSSETSYADTIEVFLIGKDSIAIGNNRFLLTTDNQYYIFGGTTSSFYAGINTDTDSLTVQSYSYSGINTNTFNQTDTEFKGKKQ